MFTLPDLPYAYNALEPYIDAETMRVHHDGHHAAYVKNLNDLLANQKRFLNIPVTELLTKLTDIPVDIRTKVKNNAGGHANHSLFWNVMTSGIKKPEGDLLNAINKYFGDFSQFKDKFTKAALGVFGSGWVWLVKDGQDLSIITTANQDSPISQGKTPILGLDVWEHAYYLKYKNKRADYIDTFWNVVNWEQVAEN